MCKVCVQYNVVYFILIWYYFNKLWDELLKVIPKTVIVILCDIFIPKFCIVPIDFVTLARS